MKAIKLFTLMLVALMGLTACTGDGSSNQKTTNTYAGYVFASFKYIKNIPNSGYYGAGTLTVTVENGEYTIKLQNNRWGEAVFEKVTAGETISGTGTLFTKDDEGKPSEKPITLSGTLYQLTINAETLMDGGTEITFYMGHFPADKMVGTFSGTNSMMVGGYGPYETADLQYTIAANEDGTLNLTLPAYQLSGVEMMGDLTLGSYTISNIAYSQEGAAFERAYGYDELEEYVKSENGNITLDGSYKFNKKSYIRILPVMLNENTGKLGVKVENVFSFGDMPLTIVSTFEGK